jgi:hypothetical protein
MSTLLWSQVNPWIQSNTTTTQSLTPYVPPNQSPDGCVAIQESDEWIKTQVYPATPLSAVLLTQDTIYNATYDSARKNILRDETTDLQEKAIVHLKGRGWPIRRTAEGLAAVGLEEGRSSSWPSLGWKALAALRECQFVILNEIKQTIEFFPEDVRTWSPDSEILFLEFECRYTWSRPTHTTTQNLIQKVLNAETNGWTITWPLADGTMEELRSAAESLNLVSSGKKKETLRSLVGRGQSIRSIVNNFMK